MTPETTESGTDREWAADTIANVRNSAESDLSDRDKEALEAVEEFLSGDSDEELTDVEQWEKNSQGIYYDEPGKPGEMWSSDDWQMVADQHINRRVSWFCDMCSGKGPIGSLQKARRHMEQHSEKLVENHETPREEMEAATDGGTADVDDSQTTLDDGEGF